MQVEKKCKSVGLEKKDAMNQARWRVGISMERLLLEWGKSAHPCLQGYPDQK